MSLLEKIKADSLTARKAKNTVRATLLVTLYSEAANIGKNNGNRETTDAEVNAVIMKFIKGVDLTLEALKDSGDVARVEAAQNEKSVLLEYAMKQLTEAELTSVISDIVATLPEVNQKQMGTVMKSLKASYEGQYDGQLASKLIKQALA